MRKTDFICEQCHKPFISKKADQHRFPRFCSSKCYGLSIAKWKICKKCGKDFYRWTNKKFCSMKCATSFRKGKPLSKSWKKALSISHIGKNTGKRSKAFCLKVSRALKGRPNPNIQDEKHHAWKGKKAGYYSFHTWLKRKYGKADKCENPHCIYPRWSEDGKRYMKAPKRFEWALIHGKTHDHKITSYQKLCASCHRLYDKDFTDK